MFNNEKLNKIINAVPKENPQNKITTLFLLKFIDELIKCEDDSKKLEFVSDIKCLLTDGESIAPPELMNAEF